MKLRIILVPTVITALVLISLGLVFLANSIYKDARKSYEYGRQVGVQQGAKEANNSTITEFTTKGYVSIIDTQNSMVIYLAPTATSTYETK